MITNMTEIRRLNASTAQRIWGGIINLCLKQQNDDRTSSCDFQATIPKKDLARFLTDLFTKEDKLLYQETEAYKLIEKAEQDGLIRILPHNQHSNNVTSTTELTNGNLDNDTDSDDSQIGLPTEPISRSAHDWYCFECNQLCNDENPSKCPTCWRIFHSNCLASASEFAKSICEDNHDDESEPNTETTEICPICNLSLKFDLNSIGSRQFDQEQFNNLLSYTYTRFKAKSSHQLSHSILRVKQLVPTKDDDNAGGGGDDCASSLLTLTSTKIVSSSATEVNGVADSKTVLSQTPRSVITQLSIHYLCYKPVDLNDIEEKLYNNQYKSIGEFFGDCWNLKHTIETISSDQTINGQRRIRDVLARMLEVARYELKEMIGCVDCYRNSNNQDDKLWFCRPCDPPHMLVFAKQKGYPYWPAKVIYPRNGDEIDSHEQLDVRFFGSNHERSLIDRSKIKDINSSLIELNIIKPVPSLDRALAELRTYRELLEEKSNRYVSPSNGDSKSDKCNFIDKTIRERTEKCPDGNSENDEHDEDEGAEDFMTEDSSSDEQTENGDLTETIKENGVATELDEATNDSAESDEEDTQEKPSREINQEPVKRKRGRPRKMEIGSGPGRPRKSISTHRIRRKKVIYSPQNENALSHGFIRNSLGSPRSKRERKPKIFPNSTMPSLTSSSSSFSSSFTESSRSHRKQCSKSIPLSMSQKKTKSDVRNSSKVTASSSSVTRSPSKPSVVVTSPSSKSSMKRKDIERERQLIRARRKLMLNESLTPKHIPTVVATKSVPSALPSKPILAKTLCEPTAQLPVVVQQQQQHSINGSAVRNNNDVPYQFVTVKPETTDSSVIGKNLPNSVPPLPSWSQKEYKPPSSILKPLNSEGETDEDKMDEDSCPNPLTNTDCNHSASGIPKEGDEEPYVYDDEQLQDQINYYLEYQREKEQQQRLSQYHQQQQLIQQQLAAKMSTTPIAEPRINANEHQEFAPSPTTYFDFSTASVYAPTKKNQNLVNAYLHHVNTNNAISPNKNDFLAQYILKKDEFEQEEQQNQGTPLRKRGRPPKCQEDGADSAAKARNLVEKSYLQETACNRSCLTNNVKAFKKFRDFLEAQSRTEISKLKRELEESKQQVNRLTNKNGELENLLKREKDLNKQFNPAAVIELEERYKRQISEIKKKQWCTLCEAEANYFCCFNTHYCSPQCQLKHWQSSHQLTCSRVNRSKKLATSSSEEKNVSSPVKKRKIEQKCSNETSKSG